MVSWKKNHLVFKLSTQEIYEAVRRPNYSVKLIDSTVKFVDNAINKMISNKQMCVNPIQHGFDCKCICDNHQPGNFKIPPFRPLP
jgi:hypothetical protein